MWGGRSMSKKGRTYTIDLCYEAYFAKAMKVTAETLSEACALAMETADDDESEGGWTDTLLSSTHWVECVDHGEHSVPQQFSAAAIRNGGAVLIAYRLRDTLGALIEAYDQEAGTLD